MAESGRPPVDLAASGRASGAVQIRDVRLRSSFFRTNRHDMDTAGFHTEYFAEVVERSDTTLVIGVGFRLADHRDGHEDMPVSETSEAAPDLSAFADFEIIYDIVSENLHDDDTTSFAWINGVMNAWSYWRTLVHTQLLAMGLPKVIVPVFRVPVAAIPGSESPRKEPRAPAPKRRAAVTAPAADGPPRKARARKVAEPVKKAPARTARAAAKKSPE
jgi:hypothetical protein